MQCQQVKEEEEYLPRRVRGGHGGHGGGRGDEKHFFSYFLPLPPCNSVSSVVKFFYSKFFTCWYWGAM